MNEKQQVIFKLDLLRRYLENFDPGFFCNAINHEAFVDDLKKAGEMLQAGQWIPVSERLPEYTSQYLVWVGVNPIGMGMWMEQRTANFNTVTKRFSVDKCCKNEIIGSVEKWMPLPEPPEVNQP